MQNFKFLYLFISASLILSVTSCKDDDDDHDHGPNTITITIDEPIDGEIIAFADCANVHIHIDIEASDENHEVEIVLHPEGDTSDKIIDYDAHSHDKKITFIDEKDLCSYGAGACFHLEVEACVDHDCDEKVFAEAEFCLQ